MGLKVISGGQTGVDRAALDEAMAWGLDVGGYCPRDRRAEDGRVPDRYPLTEMSSGDYVTRTRQNVLRSDATLVLYDGDLTSGTRSTIRMAEDIDKLVAAVRVDGAWPASSVADVVDELRARDVAVLNVAGPRASLRPNAYNYARSFLRELFKEMIGHERKRRRD